jgi:hypothetical protein
MSYTKEESEESFKDPQIGYCYTERYCYFITIVDRKGKYVTSISSDKDNEIKIETIEEFDKRFQYGSIFPPKEGDEEKEIDRRHWVRLCDKNTDVSKWFENKKE